MVGARAGSMAMSKKKKTCTHTHAGHSPPLPLRTVSNELYDLRHIVGAAPLIQTGKAPLPPHPCAPSPMRFMTSDTLWALRRLSTMARGASFSFLAKARALKEELRV